jgi:mutator protein MutT
MDTVVAAVVELDGKILIAQRSSGSMKGKWEFPGGKVNPGESAEQALIREIDEELRVDVDVGRFIGEVPFEVDGQPFRLLAFKAYLRSGVIRPTEHRAFQWVKPDELLSLDLAPADRHDGTRLAR